MKQETFRSSDYCCSTFLAPPSSVQVADPAHAGQWGYVFEDLEKLEAKTEPFVIPEHFYPDAMVCRELAGESRPRI